MMLLTEDFRGAFRYFDGINELYVAEGWTPFWASPIATRYGDNKPHYDFRPEFKRAGQETSGPKRTVSGATDDFSQQWFNNYAHHRAGIMQQVSAVPGRVVRLSATMWSWHSKQDRQPTPSAVSWAGCYIKKVGIDPTGGTDPFAASVVWSDEDKTNDAWVTPTVAVVAEESLVTVFIYGEPQWPYKDNNCYVDSVRVEIEDAPVVVTPPVEEIDCLDHGFVQLVYSCGGDSAVAKAAKVCTGHSFGEDVSESELSSIIDKLMSLGHGTPFEHAVLQFYVKAPIFVARQWMRHRMASYNERSLRYNEAEPEFYIPEELDGAAREAYQKSLATAYSSYTTLRDLDVKREQARAVLPVAIYTEFVWTVNARSLLNWLTLRADKAAQKEIRAYADAVRNLAETAMPQVIAAWDKYKIAP